MTDLIANPDCPMCKGTGTIREQRPDYWGMPAHEFVLCLCYDYGPYNTEEEDADIA